MATGTDAMIFAALLTRLQGMALAYPIADQNITFPAIGQTKPTKYLRTTFMPNRTRQVTMTDDPQQKRGLFQVSVIWPKGKGIVDALDVAGQIVDHFKNQTIFSSGLRITISNEPWISGPIEEDISVMVPVTIEYIAFEPEV